MSPQKFLEIVVPTFNRAHILELTLKELTAAISSQPANISLRVIDNCSTDATPSVVEPYVARGLLSFERNLSNIGLENNIAKCIRTSLAQWVWVFGDDDHILLHSLSYLLCALRELPSDVVFARALTAKVSNKGYILAAEKGDLASMPLITVYDPGVTISSHGSIHSLAFISQLIINPLHWNQLTFDGIYCPTDIYTHVLVLLDSCISKKAADINTHIIAATDRGDRSYYETNMCVARLTEFTNYERLVHAALGRRMASIVLARGRKGLLRLRIASCLKLVGYQSSYMIGETSPVDYMLSYKSPYLVDVIAIRFIALVSKLPAMASAMRLVYNRLAKVK